MRCSPWLVALVGVAWLPTALSAVEPTLRNLSVRGLQLGGTTTLVVEGDDFGKAPQLLLPFAVKQTRKPGSTDKQATFEVSLDDTIPAGYANLQIATEAGVSLPLVIALDRMPQLTSTQVVERFPSAVSGVVSGSATTEIVVPGKAGQPLMIEVEAQRLGSKLRPIVHVYGPTKKQLAWAWGMPRWNGDVRLEFTPKEDGPLTLALHDAEYAAPNPSYFRVKVGQWEYIDTVFPTVIGKDAKQLQLSGSRQHLLDLPPGEPLLPIRWPTPGVWSGPQPYVVRSSHAEVLENNAMGQGQLLPVGIVGVSGRLSVAHEEDVYRVPVTAGKLKLEVFAERLGSPVDVALIVRNEMGAELARNEDSPNSLDPVLEYTVPEKVSFVQVVVHDAQGQGGKQALYRLVITPASAVGPPDFALFTPNKRLPHAGKSVVPIYVERRGDDGPITLSADGLPPGVTLTNAVIPAGANGTLLVLEAPSPTPASIVRFRGIGTKQEVRPVIVRGHALETVQPWLATELPYAPPPKPSEFSIAWRGLAPDVALMPVNKLALPIVVQRPPEGLVRLTLLTSQLPVLTNRQPDPNRNLRQEKPVELPAKVTDGALDVLVPADLVGSGYDVVVQAELLTADRAKVVATAFTPVRRIPVRQPFTVQLVSASVTAKRDAKTGLTAEVVGRIERAPGFNGDVTIAITGLPPGARLAPTLVKADATQFTAALTFAPTQPPGDLRGLQLAGSAAPDSKQPNVRVKSPDLPIMVTVPAPPVPPVKK